MSPIDTQPMTSYWCSIITALSRTCHFWDIQCRKISRPWNPSQKPIKVIESGIIRVSHQCSIVKLSLWYSTSNMPWLWKPREIRQGHWKCHQSIERIYDLLLTFHSNHWLISYRFRDRRRYFSWKSPNFPTPLYLFVAPAKAVPHGIG